MPIEITPELLEEASTLTVKKKLHCVAGRESAKLVQSLQINAQIKTLVHSKK